MSHDTYGKGSYATWRDDSNTERVKNNEIIYQDEAALTGTVQYVIVNIQRLRAKIFIPSACFSIVLNEKHLVVSC